MTDEGKPGVILTVTNNHTVACGAPPALGDIHEHRYVSYFENQYREQWVFVVDHEDDNSLDSPGSLRP